MPSLIRGSTMRFAWCLLLALAPRALAQSGACCRPGGGCDIAASQAQCAWAFAGSGTTCTPSQCTSTIVGHEIDWGGGASTGGTLSIRGAIISPVGGGTSVTGPAGGNALAGGGLTIVSGMLVGGLCPTGDCSSGACCAPGGVCTIISRSAACAPGSLYQGPGSACTPNPCAGPLPPTGACCLGASCVLSYKTKCAPESYRGDGTSCTSNPCTGACCLSDGSCVAVPVGSCSGIYRGHFTTCAPENCAALVDYQDMKIALIATAIVRYEHGASLTTRPRMLATLVALRRVAAANPGITDAQLTAFALAYDARLASQIGGDPELSRQINLITAVRFPSVDLSPNPAGILDGIDTEIDEAVLRDLDLDPFRPTDLADTRTDDLNRFQLTQPGFLSNSDVVARSLYKLFRGYDALGGYHSGLAAAAGAYLATQPTFDSTAQNPAAINCFPSDSVLANRYPAIAAAMGALPQTRQALEAAVAPVATDPTQSSVYQGVIAQMQGITSFVSAKRTEVNALLNSGFGSLSTTISTSQNAAMVQAGLAQRAQDLRTLADKRAAIDVGVLAMLDTALQDQSKPLMLQRFSAVQLQVASDGWSILGTALQGASQIGLGVAAIKAAGGLNTAEGITQIAGGVGQLLPLLGLTEDVPAPEQQVLDELANVRNQLADFQQDTQERLNHIDALLSAAYLDLRAQGDEIYEAVIDQGADLRQRLETVQQSLAEQKSSLARFEENVYGMLEDGFNLDFRLTMDNALGFRDRNSGIDLNYASPTPAYDTYEGVLYTYARQDAASAPGGSCSGGLASCGFGGLDTFTYSFTSIAPGGQLSFTPLNPIGKQLNALRTLAGEAPVDDPFDGTDYPPLGPSRVANPTSWALNADAFAQLQRENPWFAAAHSTSSSRWTEVRQTGENTQNVMWAAKSQRIFDRLFDLYRTEMGAVQADLSSQANIDAFLATYGVQAGVPLWAGPNPDFSGMLVLPNPPPRMAAVGTNADVNTSACINSTCTVNCGSGCGLPTPMAQAPYNQGHVAAWANLPAEYKTAAVLRAPRRTMDRYVFAYTAWSNWSFGGPNPFGYPTDFFIRFAEATVGIYYNPDQLGLHGNTYIPDGSANFALCAAQEYHFNIFNEGARCANGSCAFNSCGNCECGFLRCTAEESYYPEMCRECGTAANGCNGTPVPPVGLLENRWNSAQDLSPACTTCGTATTCFVDWNWQGCTQPCIVFFPNRTLTPCQTAGQPSLIGHFNDASYLSPDFTYEGGYRLASSVRTIQSGPQNAVRAEVNTRLASLQAAYLRWLAAKIVPSLPNPPADAVRDRANQALLNIRLIDAYLALGCPNSLERDEVLRGLLRGDELGFDLNAYATFLISHAVLLELPGALPLSAAPNIQDFFASYSSGRGKLLRDAVNAATSSPAITSLTASAGTVTATTAVAHLYRDGDAITITGASPASFNGTFAIRYISPVQFSYSTAATGTATGANRRATRAPEMYPFMQWTLSSLDHLQRTAKRTGRANQYLCEVNGSLPLASTNLLDNDVPAPQPSSTVRCLQAASPSSPAPGTFASFTPPGPDGRFAYSPLPGWTGTSKFGYRAQADLVPGSNALPACQFIGTAQQSDPVTVSIVVGPCVPSIDAPPRDAPYVAGGMAVYLVRASAPGTLTFQWRRNGSPLADAPGRISGATSPVLTISNLQPSDRALYSCVVSSACGGVVTATARLGSCPGDFNQSGAVTVQDIFDFLTAYFAASPSADFNQSGAVTVQDIFDFLAAYFAGCP